MEFFYSHRQINDWAEAFKAGDPRSAEKLFSYFYPAVFKYIRSRLKDKEAAEDIAQEAFLRLARSIRLYDAAKGNFSAWFWQIVRNAYTDHLRSVGRRTEDAASRVSLEIDDFADNSDPPGDETASGDVKKILKIVGTFPPEDQELFKLRYIADLPYERIAEITERSGQALRVALHRIREKIKKRYDQKD